MQTATSLEQPGVPRGIQILGLAACCAMGWLAGAQPALALGAALGTIAIAVALTSAPAAAAGFTAGVVSVFTFKPTVAILAGVVLACSWLGMRSQCVGLLEGHRKLALALIGFLVWIALTVTWAPNVGEALATLQRYVLVAVALVVIHAVAQTRRGLLMVLGAYLLGSTGGTLYAFLTFGLTSPGYGSRFGGLVKDPNTLVVILLPTLVLGAILAIRRSRLAFPWRVVFAGCSAMAAAAILATGSRGGLLALTVVLAAAVMFGLARRATVALAVVGLLVLGGAATVAPDSHLVGQFTERGTASSGRTDLWRVGWRMVEDHPVRGVGAGNFVHVSKRYVLEPGLVASDEYVLDDPKVAHNAYLHLWAETGLPGLLLYLAIVGGSILAAMRAARTFAQLGNRQLELISRGAVVSLAGILATLLFLSYLDYGRPVWMLLALGPALLTLARSEQRRLREPLSPEGAEPAG